MDDWFATPDTELDTTTTSSTDPVPTAAAATPALSVVTEDDADWFDTVAPPARVSTSPPPRRAKPAGRNRNSVLAVAAAVAALVAVTAIVVAVVVGALIHEDSTEITLPSTSVPAPPANTVTPPWCTGLAAGEPAAVSSPDPSIATIAAFEQAYYGARNAAAARAYVSTDARVGSVEELAAGIATVPAGTTHCVLAARIQPGLYAVDLFARRSVGGQLDHYPQTITTIDAASAPQGALITSILAREGT
ncbi:hypothetical protein ACQP2U_43195 (plasmid) [Nocardia sp. CA-084685]|uniref:hypothetical protein n=1 Tax=Nocardia sp. CA-084685 TaxID=3239970 RepID=UPI003D997DA2